MVDRAKFNLRLPEAMKADAEAQAAREGISLNAFLVMALENYLPFRAKRWVEQGRWSKEAAALRQELTAVAASSPRLSPASERAIPKVGANQPCPCGSGDKYKRCHGAR